MGIFARLVRIIKANIHDLLGKAEDPEILLNQIVRDMQEQLVEAKKQVGVAIADEKRLEKQLDKELEKAKEWHDRAALAIKSNDDTLAKEALARKKEHTNIATQYGDQHEKQKLAVENLKTSLRVLNEKIEEAKRKKGILIARKKRAEAQQHIHETMDGMNNESAFGAFNEMAEKIDQIEAEADAAAELSEEYSGDALAEKFKRLELEDDGEDDLLAMKRDMGLLPPEEEKKPMRVEDNGLSELAEEEALAEEEETQKKSSSSSALN